MDKIEDLSAIEPNSAAILRSKAILKEAKKIGLNAKTDKDIFCGAVLYFSTIDNKRIVWVECNNNDYDTITFIKSNAVECHVQFELSYLKLVKAFLSWKI